METFAQIIYWVRLGLFILTAIIALLAAVRRMRPHVFRLGREATSVIVSVIALIALIVITGVAPSAVWLVALLIVGAAAGFILGGMAKYSGTGGALTLKRSPVPTWVAALASILVTMTLLFGTSYLFALALLALALAVGMAIGELAAHARGPRTATPQTLEPPAPSSL